MVHAACIYPVQPASGDIRENFHWLVGGDGIRSRPAFSATVSETDLNEVDAAAKAAVKGKQSTQVAFEEKEKRAQAQAAETDPCTVEEPAAVPPATPTPAPAADANRPPPPSLSRMRNEVSSAAATLCKEDVEDLDDDELLERLRGGMIPQHKLENLVGDCPRAVSLRREFFFDAMQSHTPGADVERARALPHENFDYESVLGACCENVIGYMPIPVGLVGPLKINGASRYIPMATTEGCLVASTNRGCKAITKSGGATCRVVDNGMTRAPVVCFPSALRACELKAWFENDANFARVRAEFESSSRFARLRRVLVTIAGRNVFIRFKSQTGDAMGMNMITKGVSKALALLRMEFPDMEVLSVSGNFCTDKKPSAVNWIEGRGKSVVCEAVIPATIVRSVLKTSVERMIDLNISKNLIGSAMAGSIGGFNAHASNILTAVYIATGQDPAQNVESSNCMTLLEPVENAEGTLDLHASVTMPSIEVGTVGGGTQLPAQAACLSILGVRGAHREEPGANAKLLAMYVAGSVLAGELSLMAALSAGDLMKAHLRYNRSAKNLAELAREAEAAAAAAPSSAASAAGTAAHTTCTAPP